MAPCCLHCPIIPPRHCCIPTPPPPGRDIFETTSLLARGLISPNPPVNAILSLKLGRGGTLHTPLGAFVDSALANPPIIAIWEDLKGRLRRATTLRRATLVSRRQGVPFPVYSQSIRNYAGISNPLPLCLFSAYSPSILRLVP